MGQVDRWDVIVVGAGLSGLTAAQRLSQSGYRVLVLDKSRGLGGRMATRRVTWPQDDRETVGAMVAVDHGCRFLQSASPLEASWLADWIARGVVQPWNPAEFTLTLDRQGQAQLAPSPSQGPYAVAPQGMSAVAKVLATGLTIQRHSRVTQVWPQGNGWQVTWVDTAADPTADPQDNGAVPLEARALLLAIPAAQIIPLMAEAVVEHGNLAPFLADAEAVSFDPVITVMAGYAHLTAPLTTLDRPQSPPQPSSGWMIWGQGHPALRWLALDSSKRPQPHYPVVVAHSTATFAEAYFEAPDLPQVGKQLLGQAAQVLGDNLTQPTWMQVHRWRYGFVKQAHPAQLLYTEAVPTLAGCGDWCAGLSAHDAILSGEAAANYLGQRLGS
ncbi:MAG: FAD-dependent oxidoreductase [Leptolyngbya sp.]|nr:FAD-dependent oxidoreductase [Leptolyngbya sp.]